MRFIFFFLTCAVIASVADAQFMVGSGAANAQFLTGTSTTGGTSGSTCPFGLATADGCAAANQSASFLKTNFFSTGNCVSGYAQSNALSGLCFTHRMSWNVAGVDYPVGSITALGSMLDPNANSASLPSGCTFFATGTNTGGINYSGLGPEVYCNGSSALDLHGWNFGTGHVCTFLLIGVTAQNAGVNIHDNNFENDSVCTSAAGTLGAGIFFGLVYFSGGSTAKGSITFTNNSGNGHYLDACCATTTSVNSPIRLVGMQNIHDDFTGTYNYSVGFTQTHYSYTQGSPTQRAVTFKFKYNYLEGWSARGPTGHGEVLYFAGGDTTNPTALEDYEYNTILEPNTVCSCSTTAIYPMGASSTNHYSEILENGNTIVSNILDSATQNINKMGGIVDDGTGSCPSSPSANTGNIFTVCSIVSDGSTVGVGLVNPTTDLAIFANVSGSGVGSKWNVECTNTAAGTCPSGAQWNISISTTIAASSTFTAIFANPQGSSFNHGVVDGNPNGIIITNNYVGWSTGQAATEPWLDNGVTSCAAVSQLSGNIDLGNGSAINTLNGAANGC